MGWPVWVETLAPREQLKGDAADAAAAWSRRGVCARRKTIRAPTCYVDALFGAGLSRPLEGEAARLAKRLAAAPSAWSPWTCRAASTATAAKRWAMCAFGAALTVTFVRKKPAHVLMPGRALCGEVVVADIGAPESVVAAQNVTLFENDPSLWSLPWPEPEAHKHERGHVIVASGGRARTGAARLSARAALRGGAGLVTVLSPPDAIAENAAQLTAIMLREAREEAALRGSRAHCASAGHRPRVRHERCALQTAAAPRSNAKPRCPLVLDADAITLLSPITHGFTARDVMTPHVGEFRRAFPGI